MDLPDLHTINHRSMNKHRDEIERHVTLTLLSPPAVANRPFAPGSKCAL
jgi:hypothetical protein